MFVPDYQYLWVHESSVPPCVQPQNSQLLQYTRFVGSKVCPQTTRYLLQCSKHFLLPITIIAAYPPRTRSQEPPNISVTSSPVSLEQEAKMMLSLLLLVLLFIVGLLLNFPTKKIVSNWFQPFFVKVRSHGDEGEEKKVKSKSISSSSFRKNTAELKGVFATFDKNGDGYITKQELRESFRNIGAATTEQEVEDMVERVDANGDGLIDFDEFSELFEGVASQEEGDGDMREAFGVFDGDGDGLITVEELCLVLDSLGFKEGKRLEDCKEMIKQVDLDGDGMVSFDEFKMMMKAGTRLLPRS
ncbi:hypothetical protein RJ639_032034 [Escallonia herrerae]|uniref:EF-hand domain-containing protein n=1 Tax=Escallonia herrerae TaxID=1293975 RepID=A0AA89BDP5_9ASTE|nr:hypothetical protein RJ639_032034 [Escallonia herrerae]